MDECVRSVPTDDPRGNQGSEYHIGVVVPICDYFFPVFIEAVQKVLVVLSCVGQSVGTDNFVVVVDMLYVK